MREPPRPRHRPAHRTAHRTSSLVPRLIWSSAATAAVIGAGIVAVTLVDAVPGQDVSAASSRTPGAGVVPAAAHLVTCWDDVSRTAHACGLPTGRAGLATVFPALTDACAVGPAPRRGAVEVFVCRVDGTVVRYTRWQPGFDRFTVLDHVNDGTGARWSVRGQFAGRAWTSVRDGGTAVPDRWTATYRAYPLSVDVLAKSRDARATSVALVDPAAPSHVGRR